MLSFMYDLMSKFASKIVELLPLSPFRPYLDEFRDLPHLGWLNWFIPIGDFVKIGLSWLGVITLFYLYSVVMRWVKMIGD